MRFSARPFGSTITVYECRVNGRLTVPPPSSLTSCDWEVVGSSFDSDVVRLDRAVIADEALLATVQMSDNCPPFRGWVNLARGI